MGKWAYIGLHLVAVAAALAGSPPESALTWSQPRAINPWARIDSADDRFLSLCPLPSGDVMAVWTTTQRLGYSQYDDKEIVTLRLDRDLKPVWDAPVHVNTDAPWEYRNDVYGWLYVMPDGGLTAAWIRLIPFPNYAEYTDASIFTANSADGGSTWSATLMASEWGRSDYRRGSLAAAPVAGSVWWMTQSYPGMSWSAPDLQREVDPGRPWLRTAIGEAIGIERSDRFPIEGSLASDNDASLLTSLWFTTEDYNNRDFILARVVSEDGGATWTKGEWPLPDGVEADNPANDIRVAHSGGRWFAAFGVQTDDGPRVLMGESGDLSFTPAAWTWLDLGSAETETHIRLDAFERRGQTLALSGGVGEKEFIILANANRKDWRVEPVAEYGAEGTAAGYFGRIYRALPNGFQPNSSFGADSDVWAVWADFPGGVQTDLNGDGELNAIDVALAVKSALARDASGDVDGDGVTGASDLQSVINAVLLD